MEEPDILEEPDIANNIQSFLLPKEERGLLLPKEESEDCRTSKYGTLHFAPSFSGWRMAELSYHAKHITNIHHLIQFADETERLNNPDKKEQSVRLSSLFLLLIIKNIKNKIFKKLKLNEKTIKKDIKRYQS